MQDPFVVFSLILFFQIFNINVNAQISERFDDGEFTSNPSWSGSTTNFTINSSRQLQSNSTVANSIFYLSTENKLATSAQWEMYVHLAFNTSSTNYVDAFLTASASDLTNAATIGYFVRIGGTDDEISLYRKDASGTKKIIDGANGILKKSNNVLKLKVTRSAANEWCLYRDLSGTGNNYLTEGTTTDSTYSTSSFFGYLIKQSSSGFFKKHYFDDIQVKSYSTDSTPPAILSLKAVTSNSVDVLFTEPVDPITSQQAVNYSVNNSANDPAIALRDISDPALIHLNFTKNFPNGITNTLTIKNVKDLFGNSLNNGTGTFSFYTPVAYDIIIDEIFADPAPQVDLPNAEFVEIKNIGGKSLNLQGWKLTSLNSSSGIFPQYILPADSFLIITGSGNESFFAPYGRVMGVSSFPALDNAGTTISLISKESLTIHSVSYSDLWFQNDVKSNGGWSLEMIDTKNPCTGFNNWKASKDLRGGSPGIKNSVDGINPDLIAPALVRAAALDSVTVLLTFSEPIDVEKGSVAENYSISDGINTPISAVTLSPVRNKVQLTLSVPLLRSKVYTVTANNIADCSGNIIQAVKTAKVGLPSVIDSSGIIINEILFNPKPNSVDYVEIYNRSDKVFNLKDLYIANRSSSNNALGSLRQLTTDNILLFPGDFFVISEDQLAVKQNYVVKNQDNFIDVTMPSFPDDEGTVVILNSQGQIIDELHYNSKWHFALIDNEEGISLERIDHNKPTQNKDNWYSAASTAGFGTPSYQNSQSGSNISAKGEVTVTPRIFSPDGDGFNDYTNINYQISELGFVANIAIFDAVGKPVKSLAKNATLTAEGSFRWDGLDDKYTKVRVGAYVIYTEIFNLNGKRKSFKNTVVVASRF